MESTDCSLSCRGCYLTKQKLERGSLKKETFLSLLTKETVLTRAVYLNNLPRDINEMLRDSELCVKISNLVGRPFTENVLVTDSISALRLSGNALRNNCFTDVLISPRTTDSLEKSIPKLKDSFGKCSVLYTVGIDNPMLLPKAIQLGCTAVELNIVKPYTIGNFYEFEQISSYLMQICASKGIDFRRNTCLDFVTQKKNCSNPENGEWEVTTILGRDDFYSCAYTSNKCIARVSKE
jgi:hypothetical protein